MVNIQMSPKENPKFNILLKNRTLWQPLGLDLDWQVQVGATAVVPFISHSPWHPLMPPKGRLNHLCFLLVCVDVNLG